MTKFKLKLHVPTDFGHWRSPRRISKTIEAEFKGVSDARRKAIDLIEHCEDPYASVSIEEYSIYKEFVVNTPIYHSIGEVVYRIKTSEFEWKEYGPRPGLGYGLIRVSLLKKDGTIKQKTWEKGAHLNKNPVNKNPVAKETEKPDKFTIYKKDRLSRSTVFCRYASDLPDALSKIIKACQDVKEYC